MKLIFATAVLAASLVPASAQGPVSTGTVAAVAKKGGTMVLNSTQSGKPITFYGLEKSTILNATGTPRALADVIPGMRVSVHYQIKGDRWIVSRIVLSDDVSRPPVPASIPTLTAKESSDAKSKAANDGDITTKPGVKARTDGDRTTQPGKKDPADPDIKRGDNK